MKKVKFVTIHNWEKYNHNFISHSYEIAAKILKKSNLKVYTEQFTPREQQGL